MNISKANPYETDDRLMVLLEGNIGAGKTTLGRTIAASGEFGFIEEPTAAWREDFASNMLDHLYTDIALGVHVPDLYLCHPRQDVARSIGTHGASQGGSRTLDFL